MKRAVVLFGAGASVEYKAPSTSGLTTDIEQAVMADAVMKHVEGDAAYTAIKNGLEGYLRKPGIVNFEQIYHCARELIFTFPPTTGAVDEYRPLLYPFIKNRSGIARDTLRALANKMVEVIYEKVSAPCGHISISLKPLTYFIETLRKDYITRIYSTNYDDFPLQAVPDLYTGFDPLPNTRPKAFEIDTFWTKSNVASIFHLHGSVHMGFPHPTTGHEIGELFWFDDRAEALKYSSITANEPPRMDGSTVPRTAIITGLDKLSGLQQRPLSHFYSAMAGDMMLADVIYVIGSGLGDLHLNTWLKEARSRNPVPPVLFIDWWDGDFLDHAKFERNRKLIAMFHSLNIHIGPWDNGTKIGAAWTISKDRTSAVWDKGFQAFLNEPAALQQVLSRLTFIS
jgi:hypothetical protein